MTGVTAITLLVADQERVTSVAFIASPEALDARPSKVGLKSRYRSIFRSRLRPDRRAGHAVR
ncbi:hypothetical protein D3C84_433070 [compost metagenome]